MWAPLFAGERRVGECDGEADDETRAAAAAAVDVDARDVLGLSV